MRHKLITEARGDTFVFFYDDDDSAEMLRVLGRCASDPNSKFTWYNAAKLSDQVRQNLKQRLCKTKRIAWK